MMSVIMLRVIRLSVMSSMKGAVIRGRHTIFPMTKDTLVRCVT
jgi:hypothetical protein